MGSVSRQQRLVDFLAACDNQRARKSTIVDALAPRWMTAEQAHATIERTCADPGSNVTASRGGTITYWGTEIGSRVALYSAVRRIVTDYWGPRELGLRHVHGVRPRGGAANGLWTRPDLVIFADPRRRSSVRDPRRTHALEIERRDGFDVRSVYQAHEQGRGADYAWVFAHSDGIDERVALAASDLGVGLVTFTNPAAYGTYEMAIEAKHRRPSASQRREFLDRCCVPDFGWSRELD